MDIEVYNKKRDVLSDLLKEVVDNLDEIGAKYADLNLESLNSDKDKIIAIRKQVYEDIYKIVLVAKFQGGKSTSFNAITGGECYSPVGNGSIKCSASPVMAKNVVDPKDACCIVTMRSPEDILALLLEGGFPEVDVTSAQSMKDALELWQTRFKLWQEEPKIINNDDQRDMFFVSGFILTFYNDPVVQKYLKQKTFKISVGEIAKFARFPNQYKRRFSKNGPASFSVEEAVYAFVGKVEICTPSADMAKVGAAIVDAPGLGANAYDTGVTMHELVGADAIWYLLGSKDIGSEESQVIRDCWKSHKDRMFFSSNIMDNQTAKPVWERDVLPEIQDSLDRIVGEHRDVVPYNALLALLYIQGEKFLANNRHWEGDSTREFLVKKCEDFGIAGDLSTEDCWRMLVNSTMNGLYKGAVPADFAALQNDPLSPEGLAILRRESNWENTIEKIREFVINTKSESILITNTSQKALALIDSLDKLLKTREDVANMSFEEAFSKFKKAEEKLDEFMKVANDNITSQLEGHSGDVKDRMLAADCHQDVMMGGIDEIASGAAPVIIETTGLGKILGAKFAEWGKKVWRRVTDDSDPVKNSFEEEINAIMRSYIRAVADSRMTAWVNRIQMGHNSTFKEQVIDSAKTTYELLKNKWDKECASDELLNSLSPECPTMPDAVFEGRFDSVDMMGFLTKLSLSEFVKDLVAGVLSGLIFVAIPEPITAAIAALIAFFIAMYRKAMKEEEMIIEMEKKIKEQLTVGFTTCQTEFTQKTAPRLAVFRKAIIEAMKKPFADVQKRLAEVKKAANDEYMKGAAARGIVSDMCRKIREEYIKEVKMRLEEYIKETKPLCSDAGTDV